MLPQSGQAVADRACARIESFMRFFDLCARVDPEQTKDAGELFLYFVIIGRRAAGGASPGAAGENASVSHTL